MKLSNEELAKERKKAFIVLSIIAFAPVLVELFMKLF